MRGDRSGRYRLAMRGVQRQWPTGSIVHRMLVALCLTGVAATTGAAQVPDVRGAASPSRFTAPRGANVVHIVANEYAFAMPDSIPAGLTTFRLRDEGKEPHHLMLFRLDAGKTPADAMRALTVDAALPSWMHATGGPNTPAPGGGESNATVLLGPGQYVAFCMVPSPDGQPHFRKGMVKAIVVRPSPRAASLPEGDITVTLRDYRFDLSGPLTHGRHLVRVTNMGQQPHELILSRLAPGKTTRDFVQWIEAPAGPPPVEPVGGTTDIPPGGTILIAVDLVRGRYSLLCRVRDTGDGKPHDAHGMLKDLVVE